MTEEIKDIYSAAGDKVEANINISQYIERYDRGTEQPIRNLREAINVLSLELSSKEMLFKELEEYEIAAKSVATQELKRQEELFNLEIQRKGFELKQEMMEGEQKWRQKEAEEKTQRFIRLLDRDLVAVIIGGILLIFMSIALLWMINTGKVEAKLLENAFFILLGYFFGQTIRGATSKNNP